MQLLTYKGIIHRRYKRFLSDIELSDKTQVVAHVANPGSMKTCWESGWPVCVSKTDNKKRKLKYSLEMIHNGNTWIGVNTFRTNKLAIEAIQNGVIKELQGYTHLKPEVSIGESRLDILLSNDKNENCYVEVKNVSMISENKKAIFPDSVTTRGAKHLRELIKIRKKHRAVMLFIVQREDVQNFSPAWEIDPIYAQGLKEAHQKGVEILVYKCCLSPQKIEVDQKLDWTL